MGLEGFHEKHVAKGGLYYTWKAKCFSRRGDSSTAYVPVVSTLGALHPT